MQRYFYASEFDDFIKDEVKLAPTREGKDEAHLTEHILDACRQCGVDVDPSDIKVDKIKNREMNVDPFGGSIVLTDDRTSPSVDGGK